MIIVRVIVRSLQNDYETRNVTVRSSQNDYETRNVTSKVHDIAVRRWRYKCTTLTLQVYDADATSVRR